jgi:hypothetical protein
VKGALLCRRNREHQSSLLQTSRLCPARGRVLYWGSLKIRSARPHRAMNRPAETRRPLKRALPSPPPTFLRPFSRGACFQPGDSSPGGRGRTARHARASTVQPQSASKITSHQPLSTSHPTVAASRAARLRVRRCRRRL